MKVKELELLDYLHLYMGCKVDTNIPGPYMHPLGNVKLTELDAGSFKLIHGALSRRKQNRAEGYTDSDHLYCKLILRPLSAMNDEEKKKLSNLLGGVAHLSDESKIAQVDTLISKWYNMQTNIPANNWMKASVYLRSIGIDVDGLEDAGLAIYEKDNENG